MDVQCLSVSRCGRFARLAGALYCGDFVLGKTKAAVGNSQGGLVAGFSNLIAGHVVARLWLSCTTTAVFHNCSFCWALRFDGPCLGMEISENQLFPFRSLRL